MHLKIVPKRELSESCSWLSEGWISGAVPWDSGLVTTDEQTHQESLQSWLCRLYMACEDDGLVSLETCGLDLTELKGCVGAPERRRELKFLGAGPTSKW